MEAKTSIMSTSSLGSICAGCGESRYQNHSVEEKKDGGIVAHETHLLQQIHWKYIYMWNYSHRKFAKTWQKTSGLWQSKKNFMKPDRTKERKKRNKRKWDRICSPRREVEKGKLLHPWKFPYQWGDQSRWEGELWIIDVKQLKLKQSSRNSQCYGQVYADASRCQELKLWP